MIYFILYFVAACVFTMMFDGLFTGTLIATGLAIVVVCVLVAIETKKDAKKAKQATLVAEEAARQKAVEQDKLREEIRFGKWQFPSLKFYRKCKEANIFALDNEYSITKAKSMAMELITKACPNIDEASCSAYLDVERMNLLIKSGEQQHQEEENARIQKMKKPRDAKPTKEEETFISRVAELEKLTGNEKRLQMLRNLIYDYSDKIAAIREGEEAMKTLGMIYLDQQQKESSWSIMGGIAEGIAGPAAGLATAMNTMANNAKIREYNASMRNMSMGILSGAAQLSGNRSVLEEERAKISMQCADTSKKISLSKPSANEIWNNINVRDISFKRKESGVLAVAVNIDFKKPLTVNAPENVHFVVDGTLTGTVFYEDTEVGIVHLPLPLYGIPVNNTSVITLDGMCGRSVKYGGSYSVKFEDTQNLWVMEL